MQLLAAELALPESRRAVFKRESELTDSPGTFWPARRAADEVGKMPLVREARNDIVRLRFEIDAQQPSLSGGIEEREASARDEVVHKRGDEDGLAGTGETCDAEPDSGGYKVRGETAEAAKGSAKGLGIRGERHDGLLARRARERKGLGIKPLGQAHRAR